MSAKKKQVRSKMAESRKFWRKFLQDRISIRLSTEIVIEKRDFSFICCSNVLAEVFKSR